MISLNKLSAISKILQYSFLRIELIKKTIQPQQHRAQLTYVTAVYSDTLHKTSAYCLAKLEHAFFFIFTTAEIKRITARIIVYYVTTCCTK